MTKKTDKHNEGIRPIAVRCSIYDIAKRIADKASREAKTKEGFPVKVTMQGVAEVALLDLAKKMRVE